MDNMLEVTTWNLSYHRPNDEQQARIERLRLAAIKFAVEIDAAYPLGREKAMAFRALEDSLQYAIAGIARDQVEHP